ncbi:hypothetical protein HMPREF3213_00835, partial [Heyndrickxia coagulans]
YYKGQTFVFQVVGTLFFQISSAMPSEQEGQTQNHHSICMLTFSFREALM